MNQAVQSKDNSRIAIAAVMACYNRRKTTLKCLRSVYNAARSNIDLSVCLFDDASPDGTAAAVREQYPNVRIVEGDGNQFWCGGMRAAMSEAEKINYDFLLWLNDDVELNEDALAELLASYDRAKIEHGDLNVIIGAIADPASGSLTYSGYRRTSRIHPAKLVKVEPDPDKLVQCDTMNGNCVLFPAKVVKMVGEISRAYIQTIGDVDYGYRCVDVGAKLWLTATIVGKCPPNTRVLAWQNSSLSFTRRLKILNTPHGQPFRPWMHFMFRFGGPIAIGLLFWNYFKWLVISLIPHRLRPSYKT
jgi:GT2 family glycosyltransferase